VGQPVRWHDPPHRFKSAGLKNCQDYRFQAESSANGVAFTNLILTVCRHVGYVLPNSLPIAALMAFQDGRAGIFGSYCANVPNSRIYLIRRIMIVKVSSGDRKCYSIKDKKSVIYAAEARFGDRDNSG
jgi:hypothetical protein